MRYKSGLIIDHAEHAKQGRNIQGRRQKKTVSVHFQKGGGGTYTALRLWLETRFNNFHSFSSQTLNQAHKFAFIVRLDKEMRKKKKKKE